MSVDVGASGWSMPVPNLVEGHGRWVDLDEGTAVFLERVMVEGERRVVVSKARVLCSDGVVRQTRTMTPTWMAGDKDGGERARRGEEGRQRETWQWRAALSMKEPRGQGRARRQVSLTVKGTVVLDVKGEGTGEGEGAQVRGAVVRFRAEGKNAYRLPETWPPGPGPWAERAAVRSPPAPPETIDLREGDRGKEVMQDRESSQRV